MQVPINPATQFSSMPSDVGAVKQVADPVGKGREDAVNESEYSADSYAGRAHQTDMGFMKYTQIQASAMKEECPKEEQPKEDPNKTNIDKKTDNAEQTKKIHQDKIRDIINNNTFVMVKGKPCPFNEFKSDPARYLGENLDDKKKQKLISALNNLEQSISKALNNLFEDENMSKAIDNLGDEKLDGVKQPFKIEVFLSTKDAQKDSQKLLGGNAAEYHSDSNILVLSLDYPSEDIIYHESTHAADDGKVKDDNYNNSNKDSLSTAKPSLIYKLENYRNNMKQNFCSDETRKKITDVYNYNSFKRMKQKHDTGAMESEKGKQTWENWNSQFGTKFDQYKEEDVKLWEKELCSKYWFISGREGGGIRLDGSIHDNVDPSKGPLQMNYVPYFLNSEFSSAEFIAMAKTTEKYGTGEQKSALANDSDMQSILKEWDNSNI